MRRQTRSLVALGLVAALVAVGLVAPRLVAACLCGPAYEYPFDVVFVGTLVDDPNEGQFLGTAGVYRFEIDEVRTGDAGDGRVHSPAGYGGCGFAFEIGAKYLVHARRVDPDADVDGQGRPGVSLATSTCMGGSQLAPAPPPALMDALGGPILVGVLGVAAAVGVVVVVQRRRSRLSGGPRPI